MARSAASMSAGLALALAVLVPPAQTAAQTRDDLWAICDGDTSKRTTSVARLEAAEACRRWLALSTSATAKERASGHYNRALWFYEDQQFDQAVPDLDEAVKLDPDNTFAIVLRGVVYDRNGDLDNAIEEFSKALRIEPDNAHTLRNRADVYSRKGETALALADLAEAIRIEPDEASAYQTRAGIFFNQKDFRAALTDYDKYLQFHPDDFDGLNDRGVTYFRLREIASALTDFEAMIRVKPENQLGWENRAYIREFIGDLDQSIADFDKADSIEKKPFRERMIASLRAEQRSDLAAALREVEAAIELNPDDPDLKDRGERLKNAIATGAPVHAPMAALTSPPPAPPVAPPPPSDDDSRRGERPSDRGGN